MKKRIFSVVLVATAVVFSGCLFDARVPQQPGEDSDPWAIPNSPKDVFLNLSSGFHAVTNSNYERSLDEKFEFVARVQDWPEFTSWNKQNEINFLDRLKGDYTGERKIQFGDEDGIFERENIGVGKAEFEGMYVITLEAEGSVEPVIYAGIAKFFVEKGSVGWVLVRWEDTDIYSDEYTTSSYLRKTLQ
ncbi:MAG: hypothetical protein JW814_04825 [Candidatus Krumholzibacteriota bacterium]|nr:hypothetical protein [Candidatus Krumholzibacteriota bacterium]